MQTRIEQFHSLFPSQPAYRGDQIDKALFCAKSRSWDDLTTLPAEIRKTLSDHMPFFSLQPVNIGQDDEAKKALLQTLDEHNIETVLMKNSKGAWTVCLSSQIGCAMNCAFCATGKLGFTRNLTSDEIVDQLRYWQTHIAPDERISNLVMMGMGEPLVNYEAVRDALSRILKHTSIGQTKITLSTVGFLPGLRKLLTDPLWPPVRLAISLHSVCANTRSSIMPSSTPDFHADLKAWAIEYLELHGNRNHHLTFEYLLLKGVNDSMQDARALARYAKNIGRVKINVIAYNETGGFTCPNQKSIDQFCTILRTSGLDVMRRRSLGASISGACGQLAGA